MICDAIYSFDQSCASLVEVHFVLYMRTIANLGTSKHNLFIQNAFQLEDIGCFAMSELGHGSNIKNIGTTAHYDKATEEFVINTTSQENMKFWVTNGSQVASMSIVFAQLIIDETNHGVHAFIVPIRTKNTMEALPGVIIGDTGYKVGLNGLDCGFFIFNNHRIPRDNLLDRFSQVDSSGK